MINCIGCFCYDILFLRYVCLDFFFNVWNTSRSRSRQTTPDHLPFEQVTYSSGRLSIALVGPLKSQTDSQFDRRCSGSRRSSHPSISVDSPPVFPIEHRDTPRQLLRDHRHASPHLSGMASSSEMQVRKLPVVAQQVAHSSSVCVNTFFHVFPTRQS